MVATILSVITGCLSGSLSGRALGSQSLPFSHDLEGGFCVKPGSMGIIDPTSIVLEPAKRMRAKQVHEAGAVCAGRFVAPPEARADKSTYVASGRQPEPRHVIIVFNRYYCGIGEAWI